MTQSNALAIYQKIDDVHGFLEMMEVSTAAMCKCPLDHAKALLLYCMCEGITPFEFKRMFHWIDGPAMRADAMLAVFRTQYGGDHEILVRTPDEAGIRLIMKEGRELESRWTKKEADESRWPWKDWKDHSRGYKDNWATPTDFRNMLWVRNLSDAIRSLMPEVVAGVYTPEEMMDLGAQPHQQAITSQPATPSAQEVMEKLAKAADVSVVAVPTEEYSETDGEPIDASFEVVAEKEVQEAVDAVVTGEHVQEAVVDGALQEGFATKAQVERLQQLFTEIGVTHQKQEEWLKKRHAEHVRNLTTDQIQEMIDKLDAAKQQQLKEEGKLTFRDLDTMPDAVYGLAEKFGCDLVFEGARHALGYPVFMIDSPRKQFEFMSGSSRGY